MIRTLSECILEVGKRSGFYVYSLHRPEGQPFYVGKGQRRRISRHEEYAKRGERSHKSSIIRKVLSSGAGIGYLIHSFHETETEALRAEIALIATIGRRAVGGPLVNLTDGGEGVSGFAGVVTDEMRAKISAALKGRKQSREHIEKVAAAKRGRVHSAETRAKISRAVNSPETMAKIRAARADFRHTEESKQRIAAVKTGFRHSEATKALMSEQRRGFRHSAASRALQSESAKRRPPMPESVRAKIRAARAIQPAMSEESREKCRQAALAMQARRRAER